MGLDARAQEPEPHGPAGTWAGELQAGASKLHAVFHIAAKNNAFTATLDSPDQGVTGVACNVAVQDGNVKIAVPSIGGAFLGKLSSNGQEITGVWQQLGHSMPLSLHRTSVHLVPEAVLVAYWIAVALLSAFFLRLACGLCRTDIPSWKRSVVSALLVSSLAYLVFDFSAYLLMRSMQDVVVNVPPGYGYAMWFHEPIALKWIIISNAGFLRYFPVVFALCAAGTLQVIVLQAQVTFRYGLLIVLLQWAATAAVGVALAFLLNLAMGGTTLPSAPAVHDHDGERTSLQVVLQHVGNAADISRDHGEKAWENLKAATDPYLADLKEQFAPLTRHLPEPVREFLDQGGWWGILALVAVIALIWLRSIARRLWSALPALPRKTKKRPRSLTPDLKEDLKTIGAALTDEGPERLTVQGLPARLRLVVLSAGTRNAGTLSPEMADRVLDWIKPGLAQVAAVDYPRIVVWPPFFSGDGFRAAVHANVPIPARPGKKSHWIVLSGEATIGSAVIHVALGLYADEANSLRSIDINNESWLAALGVTGSPQAAVR